MEILYSNTEDAPMVKDAIALTIGFFDGVHLGHQSLIRQVRNVAAKRNMRSAVLTFAEHPKDVLCVKEKPMLLTPTEEKLECLGLSELDYCIALHFTTELSSKTAREFMQMLYGRFNVRCLVIGYDHHFGHDKASGFDDYCRFGAEIGIDVVMAEPFELDGLRVSSSKVRKMLEAGDVRMAAKCLGRSYSIVGEVVKGFQMGRKIGFPTANIRPNDERKLVPADGVYAVFVYIGGERYDAMLYIGSRPTVNTGARSIEANIFGFDRDIYGETARVEFVGWIRGSERFAYIEELKQQLEKDKAEAERILGNL